MNDELYPSVVAGDASSREKMIDCNRAMVWDVVKRYIAKHPHLKHLQDDLYSGGCAGLTEAVNDMVGVEHDNPNPTSYMRCGVKRGMREVVEYEQGLRVPLRTYNRKMKEDGNFHLPMRDGDAWAEDTLAADGQIDPRDAPELMDHIYAACRDERERSVIEFRMEGYSDAEIAKAMKVSKSTVFNIRKAVQTRFERLESNH